MMCVNDSLLWEMYANAILLAMHDEENWISIKLILITDHSFIIYEPKLTIHFSLCTLHHSKTIDLLNTTLELSPNIAYTKKY